MSRTRVAASGATFLVAVGILGFVAPSATAAPSIVAVATVTIPVPSGAVNNADRCILI